MGNICTLTMADVLLLYMKSKRFSVAVPRGIASQVEQLAEQLQTSESKAALWLIIKGLEAVAGPDNPFSNKQK